MGKKIKKEADDFFCVAADTMMGYHLRDTYSTYLTQQR
jgi:hypothetical protein